MCVMPWKWWSNPNWQCFCCDEITYPSYPVSFFFILSLTFSERDGIAAKGVMLLQVLRVHEEN